MIWMFFAAVFLSGALIAMQAGVNSQLVRFVGHPLLAATISFVVGTVRISDCGLRAASTDAPTNPHSNPQSAIRNLLEGRQ